MSEVTLVEAVQMALNKAMEMDEKVIVLGQDVGPDGGVFRATDGLHEKFGTDRVFDTPLAEAMIAGHAVGMAIQGFRPVAEIQFMGFIYPTIDQMLNHAARFRNRTRGRFTCPMVLRAPFGGGIHAPEHHSESTEALFAHMPGLRVVIPSTPQQAYGLLLASIWDPDPVVFLEPKRIYRAPKEQIDDDGKALPLDKCFFLKEGSDVTFVTWGAMTVEVLEAAMLLESEGISAEVITPGTIKPMDMETILQSVEKTGRCVIIHEAALTGGVGAEIAAQLAEKALLSLLAPVQRVAGYDTVMPLPKLEKLYIPSAERIVEAARKVIEYT
ncbi:MAG: alpha-ketoacid dehydrogenase subunit beta [Alphaproteobacteria bacterium]|jgi:2-oxoisovalerate dehydrogenase E1 component beta subunit|nr:alpha-ketoacid dehydrogenase subunit beta [Alphaproteobacteria bacterium]MBT5389858.1 alpha-ketoacid dehydrogenase subunit beta [Alphaproteobacteria bacterium]MBT5540064.1 alpha-ketoacid dehydrogenase subunit beta [Alphaproteobacteria bacterium]